ncbi:MAG: tetrahydrodipicolinate N-succinyltransferase N-terminal domain-containing protein, partial [Pseudomonadota bacterium]|nr:tetrahydrodipicolinate N-succinyltransferase N-terminal domain-containing protein [Pseudomonadota bacterium]
MKIFPLLAIGVSTESTKGRPLDVRYHLILNNEKIILDNLGFNDSDQVQLDEINIHSEHQETLTGLLSDRLTLQDNQKIVIQNLEKDIPISSIYDAYLKLYLLSLREVKPNSLNLDGIFDALPNIAWTNIGPVDPNEVEGMRAEHQNIIVKSVDKFPCMTDYVIPSGVRIADGSRVRLGAYLSEGTTVMHEGFINFNAGTLGSAMIEGRISAGVIVGKNSDLGGGCSTMGTLSGGNNVKISVGEDCLLGANSGLGIPLGDRCIVEAGLYLTAGSKVERKDNEGKVIETVKASELSNHNDLLFI